MPYMTWYASKSYEPISMSNVHSRIQRFVPFFAPSGLDSCWLLLLTCWIYLRCHMDLQSMLLQVLLGCLWIQRRCIMIFRTCFVASWHIQILRIGDIHLPSDWYSYRYCTSSKVNISAHNWCFHICRTNFHGRTFHEFHSQAFKYHPVCFERSF